MKARYYQTECIAAIYAYFETHKGSAGNPLLCLPTGTGKSFIIADFLRDVFARWPFQRFMMLTHVKELIAQNHEELRALWPSAPSGIYSAGLGRKEIRPITFAGIKSVVGKAQLFGHIDVVMIDECHLVSPADDTSYEEFIADLKRINPKLKVIGLTATPFRLGQGMLTSPILRKGERKVPIFTDIAYDITGLDAFNRLIQEGFLAKLIPKPVKTKIDVSKVDTHGGEFVQGQLQEVCDRSEITYAALQEIIAFGADRKHWLVFATGTEHCEHIVETFSALGIPARCVHSRTSKADREAFVEEFKTGKIRALVNNNIFTAGFNFKPIDLIAILRPTSSPGLWVQMLGRGTRPADGKTDCLVLDFAGNTRRCGTINDPVIPRPKGQNQSTEGRSPIRCCQVCGALSHVRSPVCENCHEPFPSGPIKIDAEASTDALITASDGEPKYEVCAIDEVNYVRAMPHWNSGKHIPHLLVTYHCGFRSFPHKVCLEHIGYASKLARDWWRRAADDDTTKPPDTVADALTRLGELARPSHLKIWMNRREPQIIDWDYSGTAFGTLIPQHF